MSVVNYIVDSLNLAWRFFAFGLLPYALFALIMQWCSNTIRDRLSAALGDRGFIYLTAPGVAVHELGHAFFCLLFRHKIDEIKLFAPEKDGTLGYVSHRYDPSSRFQRIGNLFIGTGPIWSGILVLWIATRLLVPEFAVARGFALGTFFSALFSSAFWSHWQSWLWLYILFTVGAHITLSPPDLKGAADGGVALAAVLLMLGFLLGWSRSVNSFCRQRLPDIAMNTLGMLAGILTVLLVAAAVLMILFHKQKNERVA
jgi:hypothetical protein